ncbi:hypothetical protein Acr_01g0009420 [Actinidia rufa]|uniref:Uncharacterized protein n=1 Tax=Actinidia rufa TaxID=165716 RepID=A0A7J0E3N8_9ERIC|nr:hypothetical protein Acr_01g0009420 [Actinidia rufa]
MSSSINLGDGELGHSLPFWVCDHLGGKSYITDDGGRGGSFLPLETNGSSFRACLWVRESCGFPVLGMPGKSCNTLPVLIEDEAKRTVEVLGKIEPRGYFDVSKVLDSKTFKKHFASGRMEVSSSGG